MSEALDSRQVAINEIFAERLMGRLSNLYSNIDYYALFSAPLGPWSQADKDGAIHINWLPEEACQYMAQAIPMQVDWVYDAEPSNHITIAPTNWTRELRDQFIANLRQFSPMTAEGASEIDVFTEEEQLYIQLAPLKPMMDKLYAALDLKDEQGQALNRPSHAYVILGGYQLHPEALTIFKQAFTGAGIEFDNVENGIKIKPESVTDEKLAKAFDALEEQIELAPTICESSGERFWAKTVLPTSITPHSAAR